jgi:hypothetical protein
MATLAPSLITTRDPKGLKFLSIVEAAYNKAKLSPEEAQRVNDTPGLSELVGDFIAKNRLTNKWKDEEVPSEYGYLSGYQPQKRGLAQQEQCLQELFPGLGFLDLSNIKFTVFPDGDEGWFAIPRWQAIAPTYNGAVQKVLDLIKLTRQGAFQNYREGQIGPDRLRQSVRSTRFWETIGNQQAGKDILVLPAQFGLVHRGRSVRRAREVMRVNEFGLGAFAVGVMLLTHPERLMHYDDLWIDCAGDEYHDPGSDAPFDLAPYFRFDDDGVEFGTGCVSDVDEYYGSASAFSPQE